MVKATGFEDNLKASLECLKVSKVASLQSGYIVRRARLHAGSVIWSAYDWPPKPPTVRNRGMIILATEEMRNSDKGPTGAFRIKPQPQNK